MNESETIVLKCKNKDCGQEFNNENIQLAIYLHGIFFLIGSSKGFIGFTCPKCSKTRIYEKTCQEILKIKELLASQVVVTKESINENGNRIIEPISSFESNLEYYSPFTLEDEIRKEFNIHYYGFVNPENNKHFSDQISHYVSEGIFDIDGLLCSFLDIDSDRPSGVFTTIYWYKEENIQSLLQLENENNVRIFPRYHYHTELIEKIDSLIGYHYYMGKPFEKAKEDHKQERQNDLDVINDYAREKNLNYDNIVEMNALNDPETMINIIEKNQESIAKDPKISGKFLDVLLSEPFPLGDILTQGICNYLWIEVDPFHNQAFPEAFVSDIKSDELKAKTEEKMKQHLKMVDRVQENFTKQYVQEFLKKNLIDFLEEYEERFHSKQFSYAYVWELKESFLEGLYEATNKGLRSDSPYAIYREGEGWRIVFNGKPISGLRGKGFLWIYYIISCPEKKVYYRALQEQFGDTEQKKKEGQRDEDHIKELIYADQLTLSDSDVFSNKNEAELEDRQTYKKAYKKLYLEKEEAHSKGETVKVDRKIQEIFVFLKFLDDKNLEYELEGHELKFKSINITGTKEIADTKEFTGTKYKTINDKIKKNYRDAMGKIKSIREAKELYKHFSKHIRSEGGAFLYTPSENIKWHIN